MEEITEIELCRRSASRDRKKLIVGMIVGACWCVLGWLVNIIVSLAIDGSVAYMFRYPGPFFAGWGNSILGLIIFLIFLIMLIASPRGDLILTNKRLILSQTRRRLFSGVFVHEKSYFFDKMVSYEALKSKKKGLLSLRIRNPKEDSPGLLIDQEFYDKFLEARKLVVTLTR